MISPHALGDPRLMQSFETFVSEGFDMGDCKALLYTNQSS